MTTHLDGAVKLSDTDERARRAVSVFRKLQPTLSAYARILTKNPKITVEMTSNDNASTDGRKIYIRPPLALGDKDEHIRSLCDKRDESKQQLCGTCRAREHVLVLVYHEIAHVAYNSFSMPSSSDISRAISMAIKRHSSSKARAIEQAIDREKSSGRLSYMHLASFVSPFLPLIHNALEDARINAAQFKARKGTKSMFDADVWRVFTEGVEQTDPATGKTIVKSWKEYAQNMQVIVGLMCKVSGYDYSQWFIPPVIEALADPELDRLCYQFETVRSAKRVYDLAVPILFRLQELGFCLDEQPEPESEPSSKGEPDEVSKGSGSDSQEEEPDSSDSQDNPDESDGSEHSESDPDGEESGSREDGEDGESDHSSDASDPNEPDSGEPGDSSESPNEEDGEVDEEESDSSSRSAENDDLSTMGTSTGGSDQSGGADSSDTREDGSDSPEAGDSSGDFSSKPDDDAVPSGGVPTLFDEEHDGDDNSDDKLVDTGADEGKGGSRVIEHESWDSVPMGAADEAEKGLKEWTLHGDPPKEVYEQERAATDALEKAIIQGLYFETPSRDIYGVREHYYGKPVVVSGYNMSDAWPSIPGRRFGTNISTAESLLGKALLKMRVAFADNERATKIRNLKSGRVNARALGKRAPFNDERLFNRKLQPGKRDYFVLIGLDVSGSTMGVNLDLIKRSAFAQATLLNRMGVTFAIYAHTGAPSHPAGGRAEGLSLDIYHIKDANEPWDTRTQERLAQLRASAANLDGHSLEYYRKVCDQQLETDKVILYFSDGKMPAENYDEELSVLQREIKVCRRKQYTLLGVGIRTNSPARHGLETVQINSVADLHLVVDQLGKHLARSKR